jgi:hypothetical protein
MMYSWLHVCSTIRRLASSRVQQLCHVATAIPHLVPTPSPEVSHAMRASTMHVYDPTNVRKVQYTNSVPYHRSPWT